MQRIMISSAAEAFYKSDQRVPPGLCTDGFKEPSPRTIEIRTLITFSDGGLPAPESSQSGDH